MLESASDKKRTARRGPIRTGAMTPRIQSLAVYGQKTCNYTARHAPVLHLSGYSEIYFRLQDFKVDGMRKTPKIAIAIMIAALSGCTTETPEPEDLNPLFPELSELGQAAAKACLIQFMDIASVDKASGVLIAAGYELHEKQWEGMRGFTKPLSAGGKSIWGDSKGHTEAAIPTKTDLGGRLHCRASVRGFNSKARGDVFIGHLQKRLPVQRSRMIHESTGDIKMVPAVWEPSIHQRNRRDSVT
nr:hypothetical protein [Marinicella sp. W31]MDC2879549.1 hypothetical protein [Marinicella sp. W31]